MLECRILTREEDVRDLKDAWRNLQKRFGSVPFTDYDYCKVWWQTIGKPTGGKLAVAACFENGELKGVLPFVVRSRMGVRILRLIGHEIFYYRNFLVADTHHIQPLWDSIRRSRLYDIAFIKNIHEDSPTAKHVFSDDVPYIVGRAYYQENPGENRDDYLKSRSQQFRRKYKRVVRGMASVPGITFDPPQLGQPPQDLVAFILRNKVDWCRKRGKSSFFFEVGAGECLDGLCALGAQEDRLLFTCLRHEGKLIASVVSFLQDKKVYAHMIVHDPAYNAYSPGFFLCTELFLWAADNGVNEVNLMEGEEAYKARFADKDYRIKEYVWAPTFLGWLYKTSYALLKSYRRRALAVGAAGS